VEKYTELPFNRLRVVCLLADLQLPELRRAVIFVFAAWSGPAVMAFKKLTRILATIDLGSLDVVILDIDCMRPEDVIRLFGHVFHGAGETFWIRDGRVCAELSAYRADSEPLLLSHTKSLVEN
jgi:hypothetical protein